MRYRWNVKKRAGCEFIHATIAVCYHGVSGDDHTDMFNLAKVGANSRGHMNRPFPSWLVCSPADGERADSHQLEPAFLESEHFVGMFETFQY